ncbi:MAG TPA: hypothetical protein VNZ52_05460, partial [Candidatus Thermoplasmatota archaeon]|nr:hypothetical protein [Candidatus Thermoplasmatota archaeon]
FPITLNPSENLELVRYPTKYRASYEEFVTEFHGYFRDSQPAPEAREQYVKYIPFRVEEGATSAQADVTLDTRGLPTAPGTGAANLYVKMLDPTGKGLGQQSVDGIPGNQKKTVRASALPGAGMYHIQVTGTGASFSTLVGAAYSLTIQVNYDEKPEAPLNASEGFLGFGDTRYVLEQPEGGFQPWAPETLRLAPTLADGRALDLAGGRVVFGLLNATGAEVYTSTPRVIGSDGASLATTFHRAGPQFVAAYVSGETAAGVPLQGTPLLFPVTVGDASQGTYTYPTTYEVEYQETVPAGASPAKPFEKRVPLRILPFQGGLEGATGHALPPGVTLRVVDSEGQEVSALLGTISAATPGEYWMIFSGYAPPGEKYAASVKLTYSVAPTEANPFAPAAESPIVPENGLPAPGLVGVLALLGVAALALGRRRS